MQIGIATSDFFVKLGILLATLYTGMLSGAYAIFSDAELLFALGYAIPSLGGAVGGGSAAGLVLWGIGAGLFGTTSRATGRMFVLFGIHIVAIYVYLYQFSLPSDTPWLFFFKRQHLFVLALLATGFSLSFPWASLQRSSQNS